MPGGQGELCLPPSLHSNHTGVGWGELTPLEVSDPSWVAAAGWERGREEEMPVRRGCHSNGVREDSDDVPEHPQGSRDSEASGMG